VRFDKAAATSRLSAAAAGPAVLSFRAGKGAVGNQGRDMSDLRTRAKAFRALHENAKAFILPNAWDAGSALLFEDAGFSAIGTTSAGIAFSLGLPDGGYMDRELALEAIARIAAVTRVPVTADLEDGYCTTLSGLADTLDIVIKAGVVGCNLEDGSGDPQQPLIPRGEMIEKIGAAREAASLLLPEFFINARTDGFWAGGSGPDVLEEAIERAKSYLDAGAYCVFVPLVSDRESIERLVTAIDAPLNLLSTPTLPCLADLSSLGVRRISTGGALARSAHAHLQRVSKELIAEGTFHFAKDATPHKDLQTMMQALTH